MNTKKKSCKSCKGRGVTLAGGKRRQRGKGWAGDFARAQAPNILGSIAGELLKMGLSKMLAPK